VQAPDPHPESRSDDARRRLPTGCPPGADLTCLATYNAPPVAGRNFMSPLMMRFFTLVGIALAAASMQMKARADTLPAADTQQSRVVLQQEIFAGNGARST
jgi:hypothetical protein